MEGGKTTQGGSRVACRFLCPSSCPSCLRVFAFVALVPAIISGCAGQKQTGRRKSFNKEARQLLKETPQTATVRIFRGQFQVEDSHGRLVMTARIQNASAIVQPSDPSHGPVTIYLGKWTLYKEGQPSLWLTAPVATWQGGLLTAPQGARSGSVDGRITLKGKRATWAARTDLLTVSSAGCELRDPGRPVVLAQGPTAIWQNGLLTLPSGALAHAVDRSASMRADQVRWRAKTHSLEATGRVRMTRGRLAGRGERLTGDTALRQFRLTGGRPRVTFYNQPPPVVVALGEAFPGISAWARFSRPSGTGGLFCAALPGMNARVIFSRPSGTGGARSPAFPGMNAWARFGCPSGTPAASICRSAAPKGRGKVAGGGRPRCGEQHRPRPGGAAEKAPEICRTNHLADRISTMPISPSPIRIALAAGIAALATPAAAARQTISLSSGVTVEADRIFGVDPIEVHATGDVVLTSPHGVLRADRVDATQTRPKPAGQAPRSPVQEARANGHVRITSQSKPGESMQATGAAATYWPSTQKATLTGGVTVTMASPQLLEPAVLTGARADIDLAHRTATVVRTEAAPVTLRLRPRAPASGSSSSTVASGPLQLEADRVQVENAVNRVTATGSPVLTSDPGTVHAETIWFDIDPKARDVKTVHAAGAVRIDAQDPQRGSFHATAREALLNREENTVVLTGNVQASHLQPGNPKPETLEGEQLTYDLKTGAFELGAAPEARASVRFTPKPKPAGSR